MPKTPKPPAPGGPGKLLPTATPKPKPTFDPKQGRMPGGLKQRPGGGKGGKPPRFPGRTGGR